MQDDVDDTKLLPIDDGQSDDKEADAGPLLMLLLPAIVIVTTAEGT